MVGFSGSGDRHRHCTDDDDDIIVGSEGDLCDDLPTRPSPICCFIEVSMTVVKSVSAGLRD
jgi:hypothetical protein